MVDAWWVPYYLAAKPDVGEQRFDAVVLFNDVSGFTPLSEVLGQQGPAGTETLTRILNDYFEPVIDLIHSYGGMIAQFVGDAVTVLFPCDADTTRDTIQRALHCASDMQTLITGFKQIETDAGSHQLIMKSGLAMGQVLSMTVGGQEEKYHILAGEALVNSAAAEQQAQGGQTVIHASLLPYVPQANLRSLDDSFSLVMEVAGNATRIPARSPLQTSNGNLKAFLHPILRERLERGQSAFINEHRQVTVLFVSFAGFDYDHDLAVADKLRGYFQHVIEVVHRYDGYLNKIDIGDKGSKFLVIFGAPVTHAESQERALRCALELRQIPDVPARIGVNTGFAFSGLIGAQKRREYTVIGETVNLAARMMQVAVVGQILVNQATYRYVHDQFDWIPQPARQLKGISQPVTAFELTGFKGVSSVLQQPIYQLPMVGRTKELQHAAEMLANLSEHKGHALGIAGEPGMGKSRLKAEIMRAATSILGVAGYVGECQSYGTQTRYLVWQGIWRSFFGISGGEPDQIAHLKKLLIEVDPAFSQRLSLLSPVLNITIPDNEMTASMDAKLRKSSLESMLVACIRHRAKQMPLFFVLEDTHWIDPLSFDLLLAIARNIVDLPVMLLLVYRPDETIFETKQLVEAGQFSEISLQPFTQTETHELIALKMNSEVSESLVHIVHERTQGNPFYIDEMINLLLDQRLDLTETHEFSVVALPDSLHDLINSRIDQLEEAERITLKVASVLGRVVNVEWLEAIHPGQDQATVHSHISTLTRRNFMVPLESAGNEFEFRHNATQEVAYQSMTVATRADLHGKAGELIEVQFADKADDYFELLVHHWVHSDNTPKKVEYLHRAADSAQQSYANATAINYFEQLLALLSEDAAKLPVHIQVGKVYELIGEWDKAEEHYRMALTKAIALNDTGIMGEAENELGRLMTVRGRFDEALPTLLDAQGHFKEFGNDSGLTRALVNEANIFLYQGKPDGALPRFENALERAERINNDELKSLIIGNMGIAYGMQNDYERALDSFKKHLELARQQQNKLQECLAIGNIGIAYFRMGDFRQALLYYQQQLLATMAIGNRQQSSNSLFNMGALYTEHGNLDQAMRCFLNYLDIVSELGNLRSIASGLDYLSTILFHQNQFLDAHKTLDLYLKIGQIVENSEIIVDCTIKLVELLIKTKQYVQASTHLAVIAPVTQEQKFRRDLLTVQVEHLCKQPSLDDTIRRYLSLLTEWNDDRCKADVFYDIWRLDSHKFAYRVNASEIYKRLHHQEPQFVYAKRYREMTGETLEVGYQLPQLSLGISQEPDLQQIFTRISKFIER
ncbi:MAG: tetratricopeptide repeat protein [Chloroflexi bacterium]|nr:tetratricopeptide repeat protein [Chloroflexota bacterium]